MDAPSSIRALDARLQLLKLEKEKLSAAMKGLEYDKKQSQKQAGIINQIANGNDKEFEDLRKRCTEKGPIYFKDIAILNAFDPIRFKNLAVTAVKKHNGEPYTFSAAHTPNVEIALACRASASIPGVFAPVKIQIPEIVKDQHGLDKNTESRYEFVDGGYRDNIPGNLKYFQSQDLGIENITGQNEKIKSSIKAGRVLAFAFGSTKVDHPVQIALYSGKRKIYEPGFIEEYLSNILYKSAVGVGGNFKYTQTVENTFQELRHNALNIVPLDTKDVGTLSFAQATKKGEYLHIKGYMQTMRHMKNHELTAKHDKFLDQKDFFLTIYEKVESPTIIQSWVRKISSGYSDKAKKLLSFCKSEAFTDKSETEVLKEYIKLAATNRRTSKMDINTNTMKKLIETLNDPLTSVQIKTDFIGLLKGNKFFADPKLDIANYKFKKDDFKKFLSPEKEAALNKSPSRSR
jgi:NTE family protein